MLYACEFRVQWAAKRRAVLKDIRFVPTPIGPVFGLRGARWPSTCQWRFGLATDGLSEGFLVFLEEKKNGCAVVARPNATRRTSWSMKLILMCWLPKSHAPIPVSVAMVHERKPALHSSALTRLKIRWGPDRYRRNARGRRGAFDFDQSLPQESV
jgi:hypothetical protein